jgi:hypothetical protein
VIALCRIFDRPDTSLYENSVIHDDLESAYVLEMPLTPDTQEPTPPVHPPKNDHEKSPVPAQY